MDAQTDVVRPQIAVVGAGSVGGLLGALLHRAGHDVVAVARPESAPRIAEQGLRVRSDLFGEITAHVRVVTEVPPGAAVLLAVKAYALADVLPGLRASRPTEVLALLNGLGHAEALRDVPGAVCGSVQVEASRADGAVVHRGDFLIVTVPQSADGSPLTTALRDAGVQVRTGGEEREVLWRKYVFLAPTALLTTWTGRPLGESLDADPALTRDLLAEVARIATADGHPTDAADLGSFLRRLPAGLVSSMARDAAAGGPTELEALGGHLLTLAGRHGVAAPALDRVVGELRGRLSG